MVWGFEFRDENGCVSAEKNSYCNNFSDCNAGWHLWRITGPPQTQKTVHKHGRALYCISNYHSTSRCLVLFLFFRFFRFSHFLAFGVTVVRIFVQIIALLFFTGRWQSGSHIALSPPWVPPLTEKLSCTIIGSVKRKKKTIVNYHVEFEHVLTAW